ncbi:MAG: exodeoxyribonuclease VII small subunit [Xanthomonadales bacterium]|nr:exodeoxyribonuclease VII small subunit [Xanthomonadales bacterium]
MAKKTSENPNFETSLKELEALVEKMEQGDLSLEESLSHFERGVQLSRACQQALKAAEQKVEILMKKSSQEEITSFDSEDA